MKANKTLKRLAKIEALLSDVKTRYSVKGSDIRQVLQDAGAAIARAKEIVSSQAAAKVDREAKKAAPAKKPAVKKAAAKRAISKPVNKTAPKKKVTKRKVASMKASAAASTMPDAMGTATNIGEIERSFGR